MSKEITLPVIERIMLIGIFNQVKGDVETLAAVLEDIKEVSLSDEEKKDINLHDVLGDDGKVVSVAWDKSIDKVVTLSDKSIAFVNEFIKTKGENKELGVADAPLLALIEKLK